MWNNFAKRHYWQLSSSLWQDMFWWICNYQDWVRYKFNNFGQRRIKNSSSERTRGVATKILDHDLQDLTNAVKPPSWTIFWRFWANLENNISISRNNISQFPPRVRDWSWVNENTDEYRLVLLYLMMMAGWLKHVWSLLLKDTKMSLLT